MSRHQFKMEEVNEMLCDDFVSKFGNVVEHCQVIAAAIYIQRPFKSVGDIHRAMARELDGMSLNLREGILRCYPDLAGRLAERGGLTAESVKEHRSAGLLDLSEEEVKTLRAHNEAYKAKFGFPFVICSRENKVAAILAGVQKRTKNTREEEVVAGMEEVKKIAYLRLCDIVEQGDGDASRL